MEFQQSNLKLIAGQEYEVQFQARSGAPLTFQMFSQSGTAPYPAYGLNATVTVNQNWAQYSVYFIAPVTASDAIVEFQVGNQAGDIWLDNVQLFTAPARLYRRDFTNGVVLLNGTSTTQTISVESGLTRFSGSQAPRYQYIVDDAGAGFSASGSWTVNTYDTGWRKASGPYYHAWQSTLHELDSGSGSAQWNLNPPQPWHYTIQAWLPAAPASGGWTKKAIYNLMSGGNVIATTTLDQSRAAGGDQWFTLFTDVYLTAPNPYITIQNGDSGPLIADALYLTSSRSVYNDGSAASQVVLAPFDAILLKRQTVQTQTITFNALSNQTLGIDPFLVSATASSGLPVIVTSNTPLTCLAALNIVTLILPGTCSLTATQAGNGSYTAAVPVTQTFQVLNAVISQSAQSITFAAIPTQGMGANQFTIGATASSGLPVSFSGGPTPVCKLSGNTVFLEGAGTCSITASQAGNAGYSAAPPVTQTFTVAPNLIVNGGFESGSLSPWQLLLGGQTASVALDDTTGSGGQFSAFINITETLPPNWQIDFQSGSFSLIAGQEYQVNFWAMSNSVPSITVVTQGGGPLWPYYGLLTPVTLTNGSWNHYSLTFVASATASDATLEFWLGAQQSDIWIDNVQLFATGN